MLDGIFIGIIATIVIDIWAVIAGRILRLPVADWAMVGRWFGHMPRGVLFHQPIAGAEPIQHERVIGWVVHYVIGVLYGIAYLVIVQGILAGEPSLISAFSFGIVTLFAPWLILQPAMGAGVFASRTPRPAITRLTNLSMHALFGVALYAGWLLIA